MKQMIKIVLTSIVMLLVLVSCRTGKAYQQPQLDLPEQFEGSSFADTSSLADIEWRQFFTDTTLQGLIERGIQYNQDLIIAIRRIEIASKELKQARALFFPSVDAQVVGQITRPSDNSLNGISIKNFLQKSHIENYQAGLMASWEPDIWGKIKGQKEVALHRYLQTYEGAKAVQTALVADIAQGYLNLLMLDKQLEIAKRNLLLNDSFVIATRLLMDAGLTNALAVQQAEAQKQSTALLIPQIEQSIRIQENVLQLLTGQNPGRINRNSQSAGLVIPDVIQTGLPAALVSRRPDVRVSELDLMIANAEVGVAQANMYPALNITAGGGLESFKASNWFNIPNSLFGLAAGAVAQPVFQKRALRTKYEVAKLGREQAVTRFRQSVLRAVTEVSNALVQLEKSKEQESIAKEQVNTLRSAVVNAQFLFRSDLANYLEVITAQTNTLQAELNLAAIQRQEGAALVELYRALGGGWK